MNRKSWRISRPDTGTRPRTPFRWRASRFRRHRCLSPRWSPAGLRRAPRPKAGLPTPRFSGFWRHSKSWRAGRISGLRSSSAKTPIFTKNILRKGGSIDFWRRWTASPLPLFRRICARRRISSPAGVRSPPRPSKAREGRRTFCAKFRKSPKGSPRRAAERLGAWAESSPEWPARIFRRVALRTGRGRRSRFSRRRLRSSKIVRKIFFPFPTALIFFRRGSRRKHFLPAGGGWGFRTGWKLSGRKIRTRFSPT